MNRFIAFQSEYDHINMYMYNIMNSQITFPLAEVKLETASI